LITLQVEMVLIVLTIDPDGQASGSDENPDEIGYKDFYLPPPNSSSASHKRKRVSFEEAGDLPAEDELDDEARSSRFQKDLFADADGRTDLSQSNLSTHAKRQAAIKAQVEQLEKENIAAKEWMYIGEAAAKDRPKNSLLEAAEEIDVERSTKPIPVVTEERTRSLEDLIKQRIINNSFDDVKRKLPPSIAQKSRVIDEDLDMQETGSKPTRGLAEIYEQEHLRRIDPANNPTPLSLSIQKQHAEIDELWKNLSHQLDSLTSWRFIPAPEVVDEHVVANIPAVDMEDARPEAEAGATMLAPQEVYQPEAKKGEVVVGGVPVARVEMSREEKTKVRKREGRKKKRLLPVEGSKKDVVDTLKRGGVKIISQGRGRGRGGQSRGSSQGGGRLES
jgi:U3 small nucleolar RNA-associated protein MPP10